MKKIQMLWMSMWFVCLKKTETNTSKKDAASTVATKDTCPENVRENNLLRRVLFPSELYNYLLLNL